MAFPRVPLVRASACLSALMLCQCSAEGSGAGPGSADAASNLDAGSGSGSGSDEDQDAARALIDAASEEMDAGRAEPPPATTEDRHLGPTHVLEDGIGKNAAYADARAMYVSEGYGDYTWQEGLPRVVRTLGGAAAPALGKNARRILRFVHLSDLQLADDESTTRVGTADSRGATSAALRPQDAYLCHLTNAAARAINRHDAFDPIAFTLLGGDNVDSAQQNELDWLVGILNGGRPVECDSGADDDLEPGPFNDPKDAFMPEGLHMPWLWVSGNHDELVQGNLAVSGTLRNIAVGGTCLTGTRDYAEPDEVRSGTGFPSDARRLPMTSSELMLRLADTDDGHGIGDAQVARGKAFYHYDVPDAPVRLVVMDTAAETGGASGMLRKQDVDEFVIPAIEEARELGRFVILASHHSIDALTEEGGALGTKQDGALLPDEFRALLAGYDHVLFSLVGHSHVHDVKPIETPSGHRYWEVMTASIADFPHQFRVLELWDGDNGSYMLRATAVDVDTEDDMLAETARTYGIVDYTTGWAALGAPPPPERVNVELWIDKPWEDTP